MVWLGRGDPLTPWPTTRSTSTPVSVDSTKAKDASAVGILEDYICIAMASPTKGVSILAFRIGIDKPLFVLKGHTSTITCIRLAPVGTVRRALVFASPNLRVM